MPGNMAHCSPRAAAGSQRFSEKQNPKDLCLVCVTVLQNPKLLSTELSAFCGRFFHFFWLFLLVTCWLGGNTSLHAAKHCSG